MPNGHGIYMHGHLAPPSPSPPPPHLADSEKRLMSHRPNVVIFLFDDLGYNDAGCYALNGRYRAVQARTMARTRTPHLDQLAAQGVMFTDAHASSSNCSPSRYALLTGRYHWRTHLQDKVIDFGNPPLIPPARLTIASLARQYGYRSLAVGKWSGSLHTEPYIYRAPETRTVSLHG